MAPGKTEKKRTEGGLGKRTEGGLGRDGGLGRKKKEKELVSYSVVHILLRFHFF